jgi:hypothetical protein
VIGGAGNRPDESQQCNNQLALISYNDGPEKWLQPLPFFHQLPFPRLNSLVPSDTVFVLVQHSIPFQHIKVVNILEYGCPR